MVGHVFDSDMLHSLQNGRLMYKYTECKKTGRGKIAEKYTFYCPLSSLSASTILDPSKSESLDSTLRFRGNPDASLVLKLARRGRL